MDPFSGGGGKIGFQISTPPAVSPACSAWRGGVACVMRIASRSRRKVVESGEVIATFDFRDLVLGEAGRAQLAIEGMEKTAESVEIKVYFTAAGRERVHAGTLYTYGEGSEREVARKRFFPIALTLDVTEAVRQLAGAPQVEVRLELSSRGEDAAGPIRAEDVSIRTDEG